MHVEKQMPTHEIKKIFEQTFMGQKNIVTPEIIRYGKSGKHLYELSRGLDMNGSELFGVTVLDIWGKHVHALSKSFYKKEEAEAYVKALKNA